jgi:hypothetical protein
LESNCGKLGRFGRFLDCFEREQVNRVEKQTYLKWQLMHLEGSK